MIVARLVHALAPDAIVLFGSYARSAARPGSDIDMLVVAPFYGQVSHHLRHAQHLVAGWFPPVDLVLCTPADVAAAKAGQAPFLLSVLESGVTVYLRPDPCGRCGPSVTVSGHE